MPDQRLSDELEMNQPAGPAMPVWAPNPGVPILARILAYTFGGFMLLTLLATCFSHPAPDVPRFPTTWETLKLDGCSIPYPKGWHVYTQDIENGSAILTVGSIALMASPNYPVRVEVIYRKLPNYALSASLTNLLNEEVQDNLTDPDREYANFQVTQHGEPYTDAGASFTFNQGNEAMAGEWIVNISGNYAVILIGFASEDGWQATQVILREMASRVKWGL